ncbi:MAG: phosphate/phosphite/phosphonate ABC transporter substrate-binding protein, partial [Deltaproteobacteria bacterium]|nr:phosphate/phosphite/phosphonate ABC transporter substrate-binding protein [Deltaproteobacteria bacterium]
MTSRLNVLISGIIFTTLIIISGCGRDSDAVVVDFNKTIAVERPASELPQKASLNVAVAAMISPKETSVYYKQLLDHIGNQLGREIRLVQRKTY